MNIDILTSDQVAQLSHLISDAKNIIITCHKSPDGDAIGSTLGWAEYLRSIGKEPTIIVPDQYPDFLSWIPNTEKIVRYDKHPEKCDMLFKIADLVFCLDYNTTSRVDEMEQALVSSPAPKVLISYDREAYSAADGSELRITFDTALRARSYDLDLRLGTYGVLFPTEDICLMEIKIPGAAPMWLAELLSDNGVFPTSFSKYGTYYKQFILSGESLIISKEVNLSA